jgi:hypothetical protein
MRNILLFVFNITFLTACDPWQNSDSAKMKDQVSIDGFYYTYYVQGMWDANLEFIVKTTYKPSKSIESPNGEIRISKDLVLYRNAIPYRDFIEGSLKVESGAVKICRNHECETLNH